MKWIQAHQGLRWLVVIGALLTVTLAWASAGASSNALSAIEQAATPTALPITGTPQPTLGGDDRIIVIEGPVEAININVINIYNFNIVVNPSDPVLQVIQLGDILRVTAQWDGSGDDDDDDDDDDDGMIATPSATIDPSLTTPTATVDPTLTTLTPTVDPTLTTITPTVVLTATIDPTLTTLTPTATIDPTLTTVTPTVDPTLATPGMTATPQDDDDDGDDDGGTIRINITIIINITFVNVTVVVQDGQVWRDNGDCSGLPPWVAAPAAANYAQRCANGGNNGNGNGGGGGNNGNGNGNGGGNSGGDNDDDDD